MSYRIRSSLVLAVLLSVARSGGLLACGGGYSVDCVLGSDEQLLRSPEAGFLIELRRALPQVEGRFKAQPSSWMRPAERITEESGHDDLAAAIEAAPALKGQSWAMLREHESVRGALRDYRERLAAHRRRTIWMTEAQRQQVEVPEFVAPEAPASLPPEFALYLRGAIAWHAGDVKEARHQWQAVLALPAEQRKYRSVWAAYMLGRSYVGEKPDEAVRWFGFTRGLAQRGFSDSTGLAAASLGWQGRVALDRGDTLAAIKLYVEQLATGDGSAAASLRICASALLKAGGEELDAAARDELARGVLAAHLVAGVSPLWIASGDTGKARVQEWLEAVERAGLREVPGASRLGWAAYRTGLMEQAQRWVDRAPERDMIACWIRAKLLLRAGQLDQAAGQLAAALEAPALPENGDEYAQGQRTRFLQSLAEDLASLRLSRCQYVEALDLLVMQGHSGEATYLVERVLTIDELIAYVDARPKDRRINGIRDGLGRRLVRAGRWKEARGYISLQTRQQLDDYIAAIRRGHDTKLSQAERAEAFWAAAQAVRKSGGELMGYGCAPYGAEPDGTFPPWRDFSRTTARDRFTVAPPSTDEERRVVRQRPSSLEHWHYLYEAIDHAWNACKLMPDNDEGTARMLCEAGTWVKYRDPRAANPFYQALVLRCGDTELGKEAARLHWFPKLAPAPKE